MPTFGERLKKLRNEKELTQAALAKRLGLGESTISFYESDKRQPDFEITEKLADFFCVTLDYLLGRSNIIDKPTYQTEVQFPLLAKENNPNLEKYISEIRDVVSQAVNAGDIPAEDAEEIIQANIRYLKFQIEEKKKKS